MRHVVVSEPEYDAGYHVEETPLGGMTFIHMDVFYLSPSVMRKAKAQWKLFREHVPQVLWCHGEVDDAKFSRFVGHFGFKHFTDLPCTDGVTRRLFINLGG
jgi:hypothetical protein